MLDQPILFLSRIIGYGREKKGDERRLAPQRESIHQKTFPNSEA